jgi:hypothetical protein
MHPSWEVFLCLCCAVSGDLVMHRQLETGCEISIQGKQPVDHLERPSVRYPEQTARDRR